MHDQKDQKLSLPPWAIALILLVSTAAAGLVAWQYLFKSSPPAAIAAPIQVGPAPSTRALARRANPPRRVIQQNLTQGFINHGTGGIIRAYRSDAQLRAVPAGNDYNPHLNYTSQQA